MSWRVIRQLLILTVIFEIACTYSGVPKQEQDKDSVSPKSVDLDLRKLPKSKQWKPGDPVYEMPDLKQSPSADGELVAPTMYEGHLPKITKATVPGLWEGKKSACNKSNQDEPFIYKAPEKNSWLVAHLVSTSLHAAESSLCVAVNRNDDALAGGWYLYEFKIPVAELTVVNVMLTEKYCELILRSGDLLRTYVVSLNDLQQGKPANLLVKQTLED